MIFKVFGNIYHLSGPKGILLSKQILLFLPVKTFSYLCGKLQVKGGEKEEWNVLGFYGGGLAGTAINTHII